MDEKKTVLIIDDHAIPREGLKSIIAASRDFMVIGEAENAIDGLQKAKRLKPDVLTLDLSHPDSNTTELIEKIKNILPHTPILLVTMHSQIKNISDAFQAGAMGFIQKEAAAEKLLRGLEAVVAGHEYLDSALSPTVIHSLRHDTEKKASIKDESYESLSPREREILKLLAEGLSAKQIAQSIFISPKTVENHRSRIMKKLGYHSSLKLVQYAARIGLIDLRSWANE